MFIDQVKIHAKAGKGGEGIVAWRREKYVPAGGPAGGDGGRGGNVYLIVDSNYNTLIHFKYKRKFIAESGENGKRRRQHGADGKSLYIPVPPGTVVKDAESQKVIADLKENDEVFLLAKGGRGGRGNSQFTTSVRQAPNFAEGGTFGQEMDVVLELKLLADVGLIGFPNVGKSTLITMVSGARPKIANYHFTTLIPSLGVIELSGERSFVMADIPGLIEGAHEGVGLGHAFLRHVERTKILVHIVDVSGSEGRDPYEDYLKIQEELVKYNDKLATRKQIIVANKMDLLHDEESFEKFKAKFDKDQPIFKVSAISKTGLNELTEYIWKMIQEVGDVEPIFEVEPQEIRIDKEETYTIIKENGIFVIEGKKIEQILNSTNFEDLESSRFFQRRLRELGIIDELKDRGVKEGETINVCGYLFDFVF
jgi:GTP-binding protein